MCLAIPARVVSMEGNLATVDMMGNTRTADVSLVEDVRVDDYVLVHAGFGIRKMDSKEARETLAIFREMENSLDPAGP
jgi:hydrogenase expression/formation protein HypC